MTQDRGYAPPEVGVPPSEGGLGRSCRALVRRLPPEGVPGGVSGGSQGGSWGAPPRGARPAGPGGRPGGSRGGVRNPLLRRSAQVKLAHQHLSRLGELLNTLENVHPRGPPGPPGRTPPPGGVPGGVPGGPWITPRGPYPGDPPPGDPREGDRDSLRSTGGSVRPGRGSRPARLRSSVLRHQLGGLRDLRCHTASSAVPRPTISAPRRPPARLGVSITARSRWRRVA